jgi:hypothetical protein
VLTTSKYEAEIDEIYARCELIKAQAMKSIADAEAVEVGDQFEEYKKQLVSLADDLEGWKQRHEEFVKLAPQGGTNGQSSGSTGDDVGGGMAGMEAPSDNGKDLQISGNIEGPVPTPVDIGADNGIPLSGADGTTDGGPAGEDIGNQYPA